MTTNERDMDRPDEDASSASDNMRTEDVTQDRREQDDRQTEDRDEKAGTNETAAGRADERRRNRNSHEDAKIHATRTCGQPQTKEDEDDYFTTREEPGTKAMTARA
jgi:hypothetical protein